MSSNYDIKAISDTVPNFNNKKYKSTLRKIKESKQRTVSCGCGKRGGRQLTRAKSRAKSKPRIKK
jgi:hypothetical protein